MNNSITLNPIDVPALMMRDAGVLFDKIDHRRKLVSLDVVAVTMYLWDLLLTTHLDIEHVWSTNMNAIKFFYIIQRYLPVLSAGWALLYEELSYDIDLQTCRAISEFGGFAIMSGYLAGEFILTVRTWSAWNRSRPLGIALGIAFIIIATADYITMYFYQKSFMFEDRPVPVLTGCMIDVSWRGSRVIWGTFLGWNTTRVQRRTLLSSAVYLKGTIYYFLTFLLSFFSLLIDTVLPDSYIPLFRGMQPCLYSMFTSKAVLAIWKTRNADQNISSLCSDLFHSDLESLSSLEDQTPYPKPRATEDANPC
ncbi:hypothetical protein CVT24_011138 [Panaeolus cyanescens]|uniref:DUF6533 domain-containing protein n=1 Tax=Panaeolus cyanescens TaxID=181874 RepID=A0A409YGB5_9AGAR|nr:hypothetical protein CVT24_011138 [Panaeolus cyanescens]